MGKPAEMGTLYRSITMTRALTSNGSCQFTRQSMLQPSTVVMNCERIKLHIQATNMSFVQSVDELTLNREELSHPGEAQSGVPPHETETSEVVWVSGQDGKVFWDLVV